MRRLLALVLLTALAGAARADDLEGRWALSGTGPLLQRRSATLELEATGPGRYRAARTILVAGRPLTLDGTARRSGAALEVRLRRTGGLAGALLGRAGASELTGRYLLAGARLIGGCEDPTASGGASWTWERGGRAAATAVGRLVRAPARLEGRLRVEGQRLVDPLGRTVLLRGVNAGSKSAPFLPGHDDAAAVTLARASGANFVRLYVAWRAIEPRPLAYDEAYLDAVVAAVRRFRTAGLHVLVDLHQDGWGGAITAHGAPVWATLAANEKALELPAGAPWQLRYLDRRVWGSFEALYADQVVPATGLGLQEHLARSWARLAGRLRGEDGVVGYDLLNEPFYGAETRSVLVRLGLRATPMALLAGFKAAWRSVTGGGRLRETFPAVALELARDPRRFERLLGALGGPTAAAERRLARLYGRLGAAIRAVDPGRPLFVEPIALAGVGAPASLPLPVTPDGRTLDQVVYAPHLYDAFVDSGQPWDGDARRLARTLERHVAHARRLGVPLVVGEWGHLNPSAVDPAGVAKAALDLLDDAQVGAAYWEHRPGAEAGLFRHAVRPFVARAAGRVLSARLEGRRFELRLAPAGDGPTVVTAPTLVWPTPPRVRVTGPAEAAFDPATNTVLVWTAPGATGEVTLVLE